MIGSPFIQRERNSVQRTMFKVLLALTPGIAAHMLFFGPGIWVSLILCSLLALALEAGMLALRRHPLRPFLTDGSVLVTAWLLALSLPTLAPWWLYAVGTLFAVVVAKHLYGGLGQNPFNPAMVGYAVLIVSFPAQMTHWPGLIGHVPYTPGFLESFMVVFAGPASLPDAYTMATPLDDLKTQIRSGKTLMESLGMPIGANGQMVALMFLVGGVILVIKRVITWHVPVAFLLALAGTAWILQALDPGHHAGPIFHLFYGGAMLGAFFIATDPVSGCSTPLGKLIFAGLAGFLTVIIRTYGGYPDGVAFAILLMNIAAPFIDTYTQPRVFGHRRGERRQP